MLKNPNHLRGFIVALVVGSGFVVLALVYLDTESSALFAQLIGVFVLIAGLIASAALVAWLGRRLLRLLSGKQGEK